MSEKRIEKIDIILKDLINVTPNIKGCSLVTMDGFAISSIIPDNANEELLASLATALIGVGERFATNLLDEHIDQTYIKTSKGYAIVNLITSDVILVMLTNEKIKLGLAFYELKGQITKLREVLSD